MLTKLSWRPYPLLVGIHRHVTSQNQDQSINTFSNWREDPGNEFGLLEEWIGNSASWCHHYLDNCISLSLSYLWRRFLDLNTNHILLGKWPRSLPTGCLEGIICLFFMVCLSIPQWSWIIGTVSFWNGSWWGLKESPKILFKVVLHKELNTNARMLRGRKAFPFHFYKPFSFNIPISQWCFNQFIWNFGTCLFYT